MKLGIKAISVTKQSNILLPFSTESETVDLKNAITWTKIPITNVSGTLNETSEETENGISRTVTVTAIVVDKSAEIRKELRKYETGHVFKAEDMNGVEYLVGTNSFRSTLKYTHEIDRINKNSFGIEIKHQSPHGALKLVKHEEITGRALIITNKGTEPVVFRVIVGVRIGYILFTIENLTINPGEKYVYQVDEDLLITHYMARYLPPKRTTVLVNKEPQIVEAEIDYPAYLEGELVEYGWTYERLNESGQIYNLILDVY
jgi:hypothetical protein